MPSKILTGALKANPENKRILMSRAMVWYEMKKYPEVLNDYSEVIRIDSNYIYAYYNRAMLRAEVGEKMRLSGIWIKWWK